MATQGSVYIRHHDDALFHRLSDSSDLPRRKSTDYTDMEKEDLPAGGALNAERKICVIICNEITAGG